MNNTSSKGKEIKIPGPDHPITISPAEGKVRVTVAERIVAESTQALRLEEKGIHPSTCRAAMRTCRCSYGQRITPIARTRAIALTTAFPLAERNRNMPFGPTKNLTSQSPTLRSTWRFIPRGSMQSKSYRKPQADFRGLIAQLETTKGHHKVLDLAC
jgi:hypothetical protein